MSVAMADLLVVLLIVGLLYAFSGKRTRRPQPTAVRERDWLSSAYTESPVPARVDVDDADSAEREFEEQEAPMRDCRRTGVSGVAVKGSERFQCTEYEIDGELHTEVLPIDRLGRPRGEPTLIVGSYQKVTDEIIGGR